ncbi:MAG: OmpA family protein [Cyclobacteriaceae bacterium]|nr:OmpA family protein [Cyclobacteriaceae bacterium]
MRPFRLIFLFFGILGLTPLAAQQDEIRKSIYFDGGSYYIDEYQANDLAHWLDSIPNLLDKYEIQLISHTDPMGGKRFNEWLSRMRSEAVLQLLVERDIPEKIIHIKDWAFENPVYANDTFQGMMMNRRVDVILRPVVF